MVKLSLSRNPKSLVKAMVLIPNMPRHRVTRLLKSTEVKVGNGTEETKEKSNLWKW